MPSVVEGCLEDALASEATPTYVVLKPYISYDFLAMAALEPDRRREGVRCVCRVGGQSVNCDIGSADRLADGGSIREVAH